MLLALQLNNLLGLDLSAPRSLGVPNFSAPFNSGTHQFEIADYVTGESGANPFAISPAVEAGWSFNTATGRLTIDTDDENTFGPYTVTVSNVNGSTPLNGFTVKVSESTIRPYRGFRTGGLSNYA